MVLVSRKTRTVLTEGSSSRLCTTEMNEKPMFKQKYYILYRVQTQATLECRHNLCLVSYHVELLYPT